MGSILRSLVYDFLMAIGYFGEQITFLITCALIYNNHIFLIFYIIVVILSRIINTLLKDYTKNLRPSNPIKFLDSDIFSKKTYGMPSGHSQLTFLSIVYAYLVTNKFIPWILLLLVIGLVVIYERYAYRNHTAYQLISGAILGSFIGYVSYNIINLVMKK